MGFCLFLFTRVIMGRSSDSEAPWSMARRDAASTARSTGPQGGDADAQQVALISAAPTASTSSSRGAQVPRSGGRNTSSSPGPEPHARGQQAATAQDTRVSTTRFVDPLPAVAVTKTEPENGSAEALLSLMESVRAKEIQLAPPDSVIFKGTSTGSSNPPPVAVVRDHEDGSGGDQAGDASSDGGGGETPRQRPNKKRKSTHTIRKEEKAVLLDEIKVLEDRLAFLRGQVFAPVRDGAGQIVHPGVSNVVLRQAIHEQQLRFASARSLLSQSLTAEIAAPLHTYLALGSDMAQRRAQLLAMKGEMLASSKRFIEERSRLLDLSKHHAVVERFESVSGDACCIRFYVDQFPSELTSVKNVHDATTFFTSNLEMSITECLGHITIREDDDSGDPSLSQHRLVVAGTQGIVVDTNTVIFSHYNEQENYGILATTYVDEDELHPYRPYERIRQDVTGVSLITEQNGIVVVRRWAYVVMRHSPHIVFPYGALQTIRENLGIWGDGMLRFVRERLRMKAQARAAAAGVPMPEL